MSSKMKWICAAIACLVGGVALIVSLSLSRGFSSLHVGKQSTWTPVTYPVTERFDSIDVESGSSDIRLLPARDGKCTVVAGENEEVTTRVEVKNGTLVVRREQKKASVSFGVTWMTGEDSVTVYLPEKAYRDLRLDSSSGDISAEEDFSFREAALSASSGNLRFRGKVDGTLRLHSTSGDLTVWQTDCGSLSLESTSGEILVEDLRCDGLWSSSSSGEQEFTQVSCGSLQAEASSGEIELENVRVRGEAVLSASSGNVSLDRVDAESFEIRTGSGEITGTILRKMRFDCRSSSGNIRVPEDDPAGGVFKASTSSGDIRIQIA